MWNQTKRTASGSSPYAIATAFVETAKRRGGAAFIIPGRLAPVIKGSEMRKMLPPASRPYGYYWKFGTFTTYAMVLTRGFE